MKVLAINSSPRMDKGNTALILTPFLDGMREAGAEVELFYTKKLNINPCQGCFTCWLKTPGVCFQKDDMEMLRPKLHEADVWVLATPLYVDGMTGPMKNLLDRIIPAAQPFIELYDGHCRHPAREGRTTSKVVLVSNSGFWEMDNFDPLVVHVEAICRNMRSEFAGALLRPHGELLKPLIDMGRSPDDVFEAAKEAGRQLVKEGKMSPEALSTVSRELVRQESYVRGANQVFQQTLDGLQKPAWLVK